jgi:hypothetical protein
MKCPICEQVVLKAKNQGPGATWIRCITDGDFMIAEDALALVTSLPLATRHRALNVAIINREPEGLPFIDGAAVADACTPVDADAAPSPAR